MAKVQSIHLHNQPVEKLLERSNFKSPDTLFLEAHHNKGRCIIKESSVENRDKPDILKYCKKYDVAHGLVLMEEGISRSNMDVISLWRARPKDAYDVTDAKLSELVLPHLFRARAINRKIHIKNDSTLSERISLLAGHDGCLQFLDDPTIDVLINEWGNWHPPVLPAFFIEALKNNRSQQYVGKTFFATSTVHDKFLFIQITLYPQSKNLTKAENNVAWLASQGLSYKEIARALGTSPSTVRNQLHSAYSKLGVQNKTSLAHNLSGQIKLLPPPKP